MSSKRNFVWRERDNRSAAADGYCCRRAVAPDAARRSGSVSGTRFARSGSLWPDRIPSIPSAAGCPALFGDFPGTVGLSDFPESVRHRRTSLDFPMRPRATAALGELGISRFPNEVSAYVHGVSDRALLEHTSRYRCTRWGLPHLLTASASRSKVLTRLNTRPVRSPVNASTPPTYKRLNMTRGRCWVARYSHSYDFCIHYTSPV